VEHIPLNSFQKIYMQIPVNGDPKSVYSYERVTAGSIYMTKL
jgi:hypothetical protein